MQPPSGGCVLKRRRNATSASGTGAATFGWLCVETDALFVLKNGIKAATFGWLCVETTMAIGNIINDKQPPSGGCVLKP